jgi:hypothetical protein
MDSTGYALVVASTGAVLLWLSKIWRKVKALDLKLDLLSPSGEVIALDVKVGGRRRTDPPASGIGPISTVVPVDRRD